MGVAELLIIAVVILLLFGASRLPKLARSVGEAKRELQAAQRDEPDDAGPTGS